MVNTQPMVLEQTSPAEIFYPESDGQRMAAELYHPDGARFLTYVELAEQAEQARMRAEQAEDRAEQAEDRAAQAEARAARYAARLHALGIDPDINGAA